jgi:hypothetical protein
MFDIEAVTRAKHAAVARNARKQAPIQEALLERSRLREQDRFSVFARFATMLSLRPKGAEAPEAPSAACMRARRWFSLSLDGELPDSDQTPLMDHLFMTHIENCTACSSFQALTRTSTAALRDTAPERPQRPLSTVSGDGSAAVEPAVDAAG